MQIDSSIVRTLPAADSKALSALLNLGDYIALHAFCSSGRDALYYKKTAKKSCIDRVRSKLGMIQEHDDDDERDESREKMRAKKLLGNTRASKEMKTIQFGWIDNAKAVRAKTDGGPKHLSVKRNCKQDALIEEGKNMYFPSGFSRNQSDASLCKFNIYDFSHSPVPKDQTVGELYESTGMLNGLRYFLVTTGPPIKKSIISVHISELSNASGNSSGDLDTREIHTAKTQPIETVTHVASPGSTKAIEAEQLNMSSSSSIQVC